MGSLGDSIPILQLCEIDYFTNALLIQFMDLGFYWLYGFGLSPDASINMQSGGEEP